MAEQLAALEQHSLYALVGPYVHVSQNAATANDCSLRRDSRRATVEYETAAEPGGTSSIAGRRCDRAGHRLVSATTRERIRLHRHGFEAGREKIFASQPKVFATQTGQ